MGQVLYSSLETSYVSLIPPVMITLDPRQQKTSWNARISLDKEKLYCHAACKPGEGQPSAAN